MKSKNILDAIGMIDDELILDAKTNTKKIKHRFILCVAVITTFLLMTTALAVNLGWHTKLLNYLKPNEKQLETLNKATNLSEVTVSNNGVTVTVKQTLADKFGVYVLYEITAPENFEFNDNIRWTLNALNLPYKQDDYVVFGTYDYTILEQDKNKRLELLYYENTAPIESGKMTLYLRDLCEYGSDGTRVTHNTLIEGEWQLEWDFDYKDTGKNIETNIQMGNSTIKGVYISPMSLCVYLTGNISENMLPVIKFKDGSEIKYNEQNENLSFINYLKDEENKIYINKVSWRLENIIDLNNVDYIQIDDIIIPINNI